MEVLRAGGFWWYTLGFPCDRGLSLRQSFLRFRNYLRICGWWLPEGWRHRGVSYPTTVILLPLLPVLWGWTVGNLHLVVAVCCRIEICQQPLLHGGIRFVKIHI